MARAKTADPRVPVPLRLPRSLADAIARRAEGNGETAAGWLERMARAQFNPDLTWPAPRRR